jgi:tRNA 5-methylaminomethyl-2-thiouridine biosynthesis bifunctional protein
MTQQPWFQYRHKAQVAEQSAAIIGGGLAGTSVAVALARRGWDITIIERNLALSTEASGNPSGVVLPAISRDFNLASQFSYLAFQFALNHFLQLEPHAERPFYHPVGVVKLDKNAALIQQSIDKYFSTMQVRAIEPEQVFRLTGVDADTSALHFPTAGWASPRSLCRAQVKSQRKRIRTIFAREAIQLQRREAGWSVFDRDGELSETSVVVVANGTGANRFTQTAAISIEPVRGQVSFISAPVAQKSAASVICSNRGYIIPDRPDTLCVGATYERDTLDTQVTKFSHDENLRKLQAIKFFRTASTDSIVGGRAALRATTEDHLPIIGGVPDFPSYQKIYHDLHHGRRAENYPLPVYHQGLFIAAGFGSRGLTHSPYGGDLLARLIHGELRDHDRQWLALLHPGRFIVRRLKKSRPKHPQVTI